MLTTSKAKVLRLEESEPGSFAWAEARALWVKHRQDIKINLFSKVGIGRRGAFFEIYRPGDLTLHDALLWHGRHYFLTNIDQTEPAAAELSAALVDVVQCRAYRKDVSQKDALNRPIRQDVDVARFPAVLTEKYMGHVQDEPMANLATTLVLVTPKAIVLRAGDLVQIDQKVYNVQIVHDLDEYKNEYEIVFERDA